MKQKKEKVRCHECGATYNLDLSKIPENAKSFKCLKCSGSVPIFTRMVKRKESPKPAGDEGNEGGGTAAKAEASFSYEDLYGYAPVTAEAADSSDSSWLALYGDVMSILLIFFILLFAISTIDQRKFQTIIESVSEALGGRNVIYVSDESVDPEDMEEKVLNRFEQAVETEKSALSELRGEMEKLIRNNGMKDQFDLMEENDGLVLLAQDVTMFDLGSAEIRDQVRPFLERLGMLLQSIDNDIVIEGHTDDRPIHTARIASNWELSVMRATNVVHLFLEKCQLDPQKLKAAGYAYYRPRYPFDSPDRDKNRRIEIVIKKKYSDDLVDKLLPQREQADGKAAGRTISRLEN